MKTNTNNPKEVALSILELVKSLEMQYGKTSLSKILKGSQNPEIKRKYINKTQFYGSLEVFSIEQIESLISQLSNIGYLRSANIGTNFEMNVIELTEKGKKAIDEREEININVPKIYAPEFGDASEIDLIDPIVIEEYRKVKLELNKLQKKEEELKNKLKDVMVTNNLPKIYTDKIEIFCKRIERIMYPKQKIELYVPEDIREKIREKKEIIVLSSKIKDDIDMQR